MKLKPYPDKKKKKKQERASAKPLQWHSSKILVLFHFLRFNLTNSLFKPNIDKLSFKRIKTFQNYTKATYVTYL